MWSNEMKSSWMSLLARKGGTGKLNILIILVSARARNFACCSIKNPRQEKLKKYSNMQITTQITITTCDIGLERHVHVDQLRNSAAHANDDPDVGTFCPDMVDFPFSCTNKRRGPKTKEINFRS